MSEPDPPSPPVAEALGLPPPEAAAEAALQRARTAAKPRGARPRTPRPAPGREPGSGRDPVLIGDTLANVAAERGWRRELSIGHLIGRWAELVGQAVAEHCQPEVYRDGKLVLRADSTAWATQVRLLVPQMLDRIGAEVGPDVVSAIEVLGPRGPSWGRGPRTVSGRGPRDTYG